MLGTLWARQERQGRVRCDGTYESIPEGLVSSYPRSLIDPDKIKSTMSAAAEIEAAVPAKVANEKPKWNMKIWGPLIALSMIGGIVVRAQPSHAHSL